MNKWIWYNYFVIWY